MASRTMDRIGEKRDLSIVCRDRQRMEVCIGAAVSNEVGLHGAEGRGIWFECVNLLLRKAFGEQKAEVPKLAPTSKIGASPKGKSRRKRRSVGLMKAAHE